jgi:hypothetical protein
LWWLIVPARVREQKHRKPEVKFVAVELNLGNKKEQGVLAQEPFVAPCGEKGAWYLPPNPAISLKK